MAHPSVLDILLKDLHFRCDDLSDKFVGVAVPKLVWIDHFNVARLCVRQRAHIFSGLVTLALDVHLCKLVFIHDPAAVVTFPDQVVDGVKLIKT